MKTLLIILLFSLSLQASKVTDIYDSLVKYEVYEPEISLAIIIFETGLDMKGMLLKRNNLFAFNSKNGYIRFKSYKSAILSYKHYQEKYWIKYKSENLNNDYYDFLLQSNYAPDMAMYVKELKKIIKDYKLN